MIGYQRGEKGYMLWCTESGNQKAVISRDIQFEESIMPFLEKVQSSKKSSQVDKDTERERRFEVEILEPGESAQVEAPGVDGTSESEEQPTVHDEEGLGSSTLESEAEQQDMRDYVLARDRARRVPKPSSRYSELSTCCMHSVLQRTLSMQSLQVSRRLWNLKKASNEWRQ